MKRILVLVAVVLILGGLTFVILLRSRDFQVGEMVTPAPSESFGVSRLGPEEVVMKYFELARLNDKEAMSKMITVYPASYLARFRNGKVPPESELSSEPSELSKRLAQDNLVDTAVESFESECELRGIERVTIVGSDSTVFVSVECLNQPARTVTFF